MTLLGEDEFRRLLKERGLTLDDAAFARALEGARRLKAETVRIADYLRTVPERAS